MSPEAVCRRTSNKDVRQPRVEGTGTQAHLSQEGSLAGPHPTWVVQGTSTEFIKVKSVTVIVVVGTGPEHHENSHAKTA